MKTRKKLQLLGGITAIRVKAGVTQAAFARYLGISKSLVSMVENGRRSLPSAALTKLSELEIQFQQQPTLGTFSQQPVFRESATVTSRRQLQEPVKRSRLMELQYRLKRMELLRQETLVALQYLHHIQTGTTGFTFISLGREKRRLTKRLGRCGETARAAIEGKITMLEIVLESYKMDKHNVDNMQANTAQPRQLPVEWSKVTRSGFSYAARSSYDPNPRDPGVTGVAMAYSGAFGETAA